MVNEEHQMERLEEERLSLLVYSRTAIYVRQLEKIGVNDILLDLPSGSAPIEDPDFQVGNHFVLNLIIVPLPSCPAS